MHKSDLYGLIKYCAVSAAISLSSSNCSKTDDGPQPLMIWSNVSLVVYEFNDGRCKTRFVDEGRDGALDEAVILCGDEKTSIKPGDSGFEGQNELYKKEIRPIYLSH